MKREKKKDRKTAFDEMMEMVDRDGKFTFAAFVISLVAIVISVVGFILRQQGII